MELISSLTNSIRYGSGAIRERKTSPGTVPRIESSSGRLSVATRRRSYSAGTADSRSKRTQASLRTASSGWRRIVRPAKPARGAMVTWYEFFLFLHIAMAAIGVGLAVWLISFLAGVAYLGPSSGRIKAEIAANGMTPRAQELIGNTLRYSRIELVLLWIVVFMMVVKLGT